MKLKKIKKLTDERFLNLYDLTYEDENGKEIHWTMSSRFSEDQLACISKKLKTSAVCIVPKVMKDGEPAIVVIKEFRLPLNDYVYSFPAGLIEKDEDSIACAVRELKEEIGATKFGNIKVIGSSLNSEGLTDECTTTIEAEILEFGEQDLQDEEDIKYEIVKIKDLNEYLKDKKASVRLQLVADSLTKQYELKKENEKLKKELENLKKANKR